MNMTSRYITVLERELHYTDWGGGNAATVVMWHGLARTGRDFDDLAATLARRYRVVCPDIIGRGLSQWSPQPDAEYCLAFYARLAAAFCDALGIEHMHWVGTSMGGAIGIKVRAARTARSPAASTSWYSTTTARNSRRRRSSASGPTQATPRRLPG